MMVQVSLEFWGSDEDLAILDKAVKGACKKTEGVARARSKCE